MEDEELDIYGDSGIVSRNAKIDRWLKFIYIVLPIWGVIWMVLYWNGVSGWLDRGHWNQLEKAANTMFPNTNYNEGKKIEEKKKISRHAARVNN